jgi:hypothetical protein
MLILLSSAFALALAGCGGSDSSSPEPQSAPLPSPPTVPPLSTATPIVLSFGSTVGTTQHWQDGDTSTGGQGADIDGLSCLQTMPEDYHVHVHVSIFLNGDQLIVPKQIGIPRGPGDTDKCFYSLHTHDGSGEIHVEAAAPATFTLGQLFDIWGQPLDTTNVNVGAIVGLPITIYMFDDGETKATVYTDDPRKLELTRHRQITIQIGTAISTIPVYDFAGA